jgi:solute carrier family 6 (neurotransmitter transporter, glycine) member 5/9
MILGQFTSKGSMKAVETIPLMKGIGWGQQIASAVITTYYSAIIAITLKFLIGSFSVELPWSVCNSNYSDKCIPAKSTEYQCFSKGVRCAENDAQNVTASTIFYF